MSDTYSPERRQQLMDRIRIRSAVIGPKSAEQAAFYVSQGVLTAEQAAFWLENRRRVDAYLELDFEQRLQQLHEANRSRPRTKTRIIDIPEIRALYRESLVVKRDNPQYTWEQVCANICVPYGTWKHWRTYLKDIVILENDPK